MADTVHTLSPRLERNRLQQALLSSSTARGLQQLLRRRSTIALLMCLPLILIVACLIIYPALYSIYLSMLNKAQTRFVGLDVHRKYATVAAVDSKQQVVLTARRIDFNDFDEWVRKHLRRTDVVTLEATSNAWHL